MSDAKIRNLSARVTIPRRCGCIGLTETFPLEAARPDMLAQMAASAFRFKTRCLRDYRHPGPCWFHLLGVGHESSPSGLE